MADSSATETSSNRRRARCFLIGGVSCDEGAEDLQERLAQAYRDKLRPLCLCREPGLAMYVAKIGDQFVLKRMPLSGAEHDPSCPSYEPPYDLSGLGALIGSAIKLDRGGTAALKLDFALSKRGPRGKPASEGTVPDSVENDSKRLSLRALLHLLWHESGLTEWTAHWAGKRHWWQVYHHLVEAARTMSVRGEALSKRLFVPEPFRTEDKPAIEQRRAQALNGLSVSDGGPRKLMLLVGEVKEFAPARSGQQVVVKHMPGFRLHLEEPTWRRVQRRFEDELTLWRSDDRFHLMTIATIESSAGGLVTIDEIALMTVTEQWLPVETAYEERLLGKLTRMRGKTVKGLRFNLPGDQPIANAIMPEARPRPTALYIVPPNADAQFEVSLRDMIEARPDMANWIWRIADGDMPALPWE
ncbi:hypothetical protein J2046_006566 [Rhizobium petrolearium]|uniref:DUF1173 domain-containing protein n=2 Tax=Neorhizobium TaxID=1525371 RepID=A0ABV0MCL0_9HYPH|nr:DUF1173 domain-containing protein [Neorhizobium petrolearium]MBP1848275.1 hypothetical protein [Neorhizobium petrolearium]MCC2614430.1 DUF1173 domain-containing protein [Neorhizobium petrolearium]WGI72527.1 DUF1173 domain-containing protein [Neorhizobium petrolearium]